MIFEPDRVREAAPGQRELGLNEAGDDDIVGGGARPLLVLILFEVVGVGLDRGEYGLRGAEGGDALEHGEDFESVNVRGFDADVRGDGAGYGHEGGGGRGE